MAIDNIVTVTINGSEQSFIWEDVKKDGNCLYHALAWHKVTANENIGAAQIRQEIADYIEQHWEEYKKDISDEDFSKNGQSLRDNKKVEQLLNGTPEEQEELKRAYIALIKKNGVWGDELQIRVASIIYNKHIVVVDSDYKVLDYPDNEDNNPIIYLRRVGQNHYMPMLDLKQKIADLLNDQEIIDYLNNKSTKELKDFYESILKSANKTQGFEQAKEQASSSTKDLGFEGIIKNIMSAFSDPEVINQFSGFFGVIQIMFHKIMLIFNPGMEFGEHEKAYIPYGAKKFAKHKEAIKAKAEHSKLVDIFDKAGEHGRTLYREMLKKAHQAGGTTKERLLYELLKNIKHSGLYDKNAHEIMSDIENYLSEVDISKLLEETTKDKKIVTRIADKITQVKRQIEDLITKIKDEQDTLSTEDKFNLWKIIQNLRLKLASCILKIKAFAQNTTVTDKQPFEEQLQKFFGRVAMDNRERDVEVEEIPNNNNDYDANKSILKKLDTYYTESDNLLNEAIKKANESRKQDIDNIKKDIKKRITDKKEQLNEFKEAFEHLENTSHLGQLVDGALYLLDGYLVNRGKADEDIKLPEQIVALLSTKNGLSAQEYKKCYQSLGEFEEKLVRDEQQADNACNLATYFKDPLPAQNAANQPRP